MFGRLNDIIDKPRPDSFLVGVDKRQQRCDGGRAANAIPPGKRERTDPLRNRVSSRPWQNFLDANTPDGSCVEEKETFGQLWPRRSSHDGEIAAEGVSGNVAGTLDNLLDEVDHLIHPELAGIRQLIGFDLQVHNIAEAPLEPFLRVDPSRSWILRRPAFPLSDDVHGPDFEMFRELIHIPFIVKLPHTESRQQQQRHPFSILLVVYFPAISPFPVLGFPSLQLLLSGCRRQTLAAASQELSPVSLRTCKPGRRNQLLDMVLQAHVLACTT
mmetsp:Transcript_11765/g.27035  ORF Transcript_11765/g.27035 Transcript_11765/m.27035 type:complete len:271 (-) Transcript_11765:97-909(-)